MDVINNINNDRDLMEFAVPTIDAILTGIVSNYSSFIKQMLLITQSVHHMINWYFKHYSLQEKLTIMITSVF
jgi:hypothetical protein